MCQLPGLLHLKARNRYGSGDCRSGGREEDERERTMRVLSSRGAKIR